MVFKTLTLLIRSVPHRGTPRWGTESLLNALASLNLSFCFLNLSFSFLNLYFCFLNLTFGRVKLFFSFQYFRFIP